jgi:hypothetical protein
MPDATGAPATPNASGVNAQSMTLFPTSDDGGVNAQSMELFPTDTNIGALFAPYWPTSQRPTTGLIWPRPPEGR